MPPALERVEFPAETRMHHPAVVESRGESEEGRDDLEEPIPLRLAVPDPPDRGRDHESGGEQDDDDDDIPQGLLTHPLPEFREVQQAETLATLILRLPQPPAADDRAPGQQDGEEKEGASTVTRRTMSSSKTSS